MGSPRIVIVGAGGYVFPLRLSIDILSFPELQSAHLVLYDINEENLKRTFERVKTVVGANKLPAKVEMTTQRRKALKGADYVIVAFQVGGVDAYAHDVEIPRKYGLDQCVGDTLGPGGVFRGLRSIGALKAIAQDMLDVCPDALMLQYANPMAMNCWAISRATRIHTVGLCHSVPHTAWELSQDIGVPVDEIDYLVAGINHMAFYLRFQRDGQDLYPLLRKVVEEGRIPAFNQVRYEMFQRLGYFVTESSEHFSEYVPWFIKRDRPDLIEKFGIPLDEYPKRCIEQIARWEREAKEYREANEIVVKPSHEYASQIVNSVVTGEPSEIYGNVPNKGFIPQLPAGCAVEVPTLVDNNGLQPTVVQDIPPQLIALMRTNINVQDLTVQALLTENVEHVYHAAMLDPHTGAELDLDQIWELTTDLLAAHDDWLPEFARVKPGKAA